MLTLEAPGRQDPPQDQLLGPGPASSPESEPERAGFTKPPTHTHTDRQTALSRPEPPNRSRPFRLPWYDRTRRWGPFLCYANERCSSALAQQQSGSQHPDTSSPSQRCRPD